MRHTIARAEAVAPQWFSRVPEQRCEVAPVPDAEAESGSIAYYIDPSLDGSRPGTYYANTYDAEKRPRFTSAKSSRSTSGPSSPFIAPSPIAQAPATSAPAHATLVTPMAVDDA